MHNGFRCCAEERTTSSREREDTVLLLCIHGLVWMRARVCAYWSAGYAPGGGCPRRRNAAIEGCEGNGEERNIVS